MKNSKRSAKIGRGLTAVTASLLSIAVGGTSIANANLAFLNTRLGTYSQKIVDKGDGSADSVYYESEFTSLGDLVKAKEELAEQISEEGSVLFKNNNKALPLDKATETVTLWGMNSHTPTLGGMIGSSTAVDAAHGQKAYGIEEAMTEKGFSLNQDMIDLYAGDAAMAYARRGFGQTGHGLSPAFGMTYENPSTYPVGEIPASLYTDDLLSAADSTAAVVVISRDSSEAADYNPNMTNATEGDSFERPLALSDYEKEMIGLAKKHSTKVIVLVNADNPMELEDLKNDDEIDAILWVGAPGINGFKGVADVLSGDANPSGHISDTYAANSASAPSMVNYGVYLYSNSTQAGADAVLTEANKADWYVVETESIYNGYKYYETRYEDAVLGQGNADSAAGATSGAAWSYEEEVTYPFGYGISYTTFEQTLENVNVEVGGTGTATVTVKNTGDVAGKSTAQLYVQAPYTRGGLEKSAIQLIGFAKTDVLEPGASETLTIEFDPQYMASYDETVTKADGTDGAWVLDKGDYYFAIGNGAHEALNNVLAKKTGSTEGLVTIVEDETINAENALVWNLNARDVETYSVNVENALQDMDINKLIPGTAEYTTRADWTKGWTPVETITPTEEMMVALTNSKYELTVNGDGVTWGADNDLKLIDMLEVNEDGTVTGVVDINDPKWDLLMDELTLDEAIQFIEKGGDDMENIDSILLPRTYQNDGPLGFTYDQVGGYYIRWTPQQANEPTYVEQTDEYGTYSMNSMPTEPVVAATFNVELLEREGQLFGEDALWSNESSLFGPGLNLHRTPYNARNHEYYSEDSMLMNILGTAVCKGGKSKGLMMEPKHLAFNHQETNRSGMSTFMTEQAARENELRGFQGPMSSNMADGVMTAFNRAGATYAGAHEGLLVQIVRNEWGYDGWIVTDMINGADYMNWKDITFAGGGNCLTTSAYDTSSIGTMAASKDKISKDTAFQQQMKTNIKYWLYNTVQSNAMNGLTYDSELVDVLTWWQIVLYVLIAALAVLTAGSAAMYVINARKSRQEA